MTKSLFLKKKEMKAWPVKYKIPIILNETPSNMQKISALEESLWKIRKRIILILSISGMSSAKQLYYPECAFFPDNSNGI